MKYTCWSNIKFFSSMFFGLLLTIAVFLVGWGMAFTSIDLNNSNVISGTVTSTNIQQTRGTKAVPGQHDLIVYVNGSATGFWIYRASQNYSDLVAHLSAGTGVKIYCSNNIGSNNYYTVYQVEAKNSVVYSKGEYEGKEKLAGRYIVLPGVFLLLFAIYWQIKKRYKAPKPMPE